MSKENIFLKLPDFNKIIELTNKVLDGDAGIFSQVLDWAFVTAVTADLPGLESADKLASEYKSKEGTIEQQVDMLIHDYWIKAGVMGVATDIGGIATLPFNIVSATVLQLRMASAIAIMGGWSLEDTKVKNLLKLCALGSNAVSSLTNTAVTKATERFAAKLAGKSLGKTIPMFSMVFSGAIDAATTRSIGKVTKRFFITDIPDVLTAEAEFLE